MHIKKTNYGCHVIHEHNLDVCVTSSDIQVFFDREILTVLSDGKAIVSVHGVKLKSVVSDYTIEVA